MGICDWDHEAGDVRRLPLYDQNGKRSDAAVFVCYDHWQQEVEAVTPVGRRALWREWQNLESQEND